MANAADAHHDDHGHDDHYPGFFSRWFCSTNHKDIGTVYLYLSMFAAIVGGAMSWYIRLELAEPGAVCVLEERANALLELPAGFEELDRRTSGDSQVVFLKRS